MKPSCLVVIGAGMLLSALVQMACAPAKGAARAAEMARDPVITDEVEHEIRASVSLLPLKPDERFRDFLGRARAALISSDNPHVRALAVRLPDRLTYIPNASVRRAMPILVARWAKGFRRQARVETLLRFLRHRTVNAPDSETPGRSPAFDAFEADLMQTVADLGLFFDHVDHVAYEIGYPPRDPTKAARQRTWTREHGISLLAHADVVPAEEPGWIVDPFGGTIDERGRILGRGALDDKGALVAALYAMAALKASGLVLPRSPTLVVGTSEETHWAGIERYQQQRKLGQDVIVIDGSFPVGAGEKGITTVHVRTEPPEVGALNELATYDTQLLDFDGGQRANQVPAAAQARLAFTPHADPEVVWGRLSDAATRWAHDGRAAVVVRRDESGLFIEARGTAAHSAEPENGTNAILSLLAFIVEHARVMPTPCVGLGALLVDRLGQGFAGAALGVPDKRDGYTPSTAVVGRMQRQASGACEAQISIRWPPPRTAAAVVRGVRDLLVRRAAMLRPPLVLTVEGGGLDPFEVPADAPLVQALFSAYRADTDEAAAPKYLSGTTYAKAVQGGVTFGPEPEKDAGGRMHSANEWLSLDEFDALVELYTFAIARRGM